MSEWDAPELRPTATPEPPGRWIERGDGWLIFVADDENALWDAAASDDQDDGEIDRPVAGGA